MPQQDGPDLVLISAAQVYSILRAQKSVIFGFATALFLVTLVASVLATKKYTATTILQISIQAGQELKSEKVIDLDQYNRWNRDIYITTQVGILKGRMLRERVVERFREATPEGPGREVEPEDLLKMLVIETGEGTELVGISIRHTDPTAAAVFANLVADEYGRSNLERSRESAREARLWVQQQLEEQALRMDELAEQVVVYQATHDLADAEEEDTRQSTLLASLNQANATNQTAIVSQQARITAHETLARQGKYTELAKDMGTPLVGSLTQEYATSVTEHAKLAAKYGERHPQRVAIEAKLARINEELRTEVQSMLGAERARLVLLEQSRDSLGKELAVVHQNMLDHQRGFGGYEKLKREHERSKNYFARLSARKDELELQSRTQLNNVRVIESALPPIQHSSPNLLLNLGFATVLGLIFGAGLGLVREFADDRVNSPHDVKVHLRVPYLGHVPQIVEPNRKAQALYTHNNPNSAAAEAVRAIRTLIDISPRTRSLRRILVTSALQSEGKTANSVRLAIAFTKLDRSVLIIDADLRRPRIHTVFDLNRDRGLTLCLEGKPLAGQAIQTCVPGLQVLAVGPNSMRATEKLGSESMKRVLDEASELFDMVIIDSPPAALIADAAILSQAVDGIVMVVREQHASRGMIRKSIQDLEAVGANIIGVIMNAVDMKKAKQRGGQYYGQGYGYGYGYGAMYGEAYSPDSPEVADT